MSNENGTALVTRAEETARSAPALSADAATFNTAQRMAVALSSSTVVPAAYQNNPANVIVAMEYANRLGASVLAVMQNLHIIKGKPSLAASFLIGAVNATGKFTPIRYRWQGTEGTDSWGCRAYAMDRANGEECPGPLITIAIAKAEGWYSKKDKHGNETSKWQTFPELMLMYRAGAWWSRVYCPELSLGLHTTDELEDMGPVAAAVRVQSIAEALDAGDVDTEEVDQDKALDPMRKLYFAKWGEITDGQRTTDAEASRHAWQVEHMGEEKASTKTWDKADYRKAIDLLTEGIGL